jgi:hypothetical protein
MAKAKFKVTDRAESDLGTVIHTTVELLNEDGTMVEYGVKEYHDDHQGKIIDVEIENMTNGRDVGENSVLGKQVLAQVDEYNNENDYDKYADDPNLEVQMNQDEISMSEKLNNFLADIGIIDEHFEDQIHTLIMHYTKYKKHQQDFEDNYPEGDPAYEAHVNKMNDDIVVPCSAKLDNEMYNESI